MFRPCVARGFVELSGRGLASMYPASDWSLSAPGHHGYQRASDLTSGQVLLRNTHLGSGSPTRKGLNAKVFPDIATAARRQGFSSIIAYRRTSLWVANSH